jgi:hypothetical protein
MIYHIKLCLFCQDEPECLHAESRRLFAFWGEKLYNVLAWVDNEKQNQGIDKAAQ